MDLIDMHSGSTISESVGRTAPCRAHGGTSKLLLGSDLQTGQRRSSEGPGGRTRPLQEGVDGERPGELDASGAGGSAGRAGLLRGSAHVLRSHLGGQLREELQDPFKVTPHHLRCDVAAVQLPVVSLALRRIQINWDLKTQHVRVERVCNNVTQKQKWWLTRRYCKCYST